MVEPNIDKLYVQQRDINLRVAFAELRQAEAADIIHKAENDTALTQEANAYYTRAGHATKKQISRSITRNQLKRAGKAISPVARVAAYVLLFCYVSLSTAIAASPAFRNHFTQFLINIGSEYTELELRETGETFHVPDAWQGDYYLSYIPEGYDLFHIESDNNDHSVTYTDEFDDIICFDEYTMDTLVNIDTEGTEAGYIQINGHNIFSAQKENFAVYTWSEFDRYFILWFSGKTDIAENVLRGILRIR